ncbi:MAG: hypothetical protein K0R93_2028 [Anaerosolibacter sp.]|jgi:hypothetical protein|uniref:hypothetical protein n=1 Tax=Anaerosolibacter sp. TaxID=1872527 RepID=UPI0026232F05|nr:hypothetical protein [Anaerosolibacter sp.]MDF2547130.1 hypothetical protein [Anaerosolibacter sp.]
MSWILFVISAIGSYIIFSVQLGRPGGLLEVFISISLAAIFQLPRLRKLRQKATISPKGRKQRK